MWTEINRIAESRISRAVARGEFDGLPGAGRPLVLDDDSMVPPEMRLALRVMKNAGLVPEELRLRGEIAALERVVRESAGASRGAAMRRLEALRIRLDAGSGRLRSLARDGEYATRVIARFDRAPIQDPEPLSPPGP